jgi:hypothetical protein
LAWPHRGLPVGREAVSFAAGHGDDNGAMFPADNGAMVSQAAFYRRGVRVPPPSHHTLAPLFRDSSLG